MCDALKKNQRSTSLVQNLILTHFEKLEQKIETLSKANTGSRNIRNDQKHAQQTHVQHK